MTVLFLIAWMPASHVHAADPLDFARDVRPILQEHCLDCHSGSDAESSLRLDAGAGILDGGNSGPLLVPGKSAASLIIQRVTSTDLTQRMPPEDAGDALSAAAIETLKAWIDQGAVGLSDQPTTDEPQAGHDHWSFQPVTRPALPPVQDPSWVRNPIDVFVLARLETAQLQPSPAADRYTLIRRLSLDLRGVPPTVDEADQFASDARPGAYERLVDRLLASPLYGERWGRHWLDQARYADSDGYTNDVPRSIWKYRDWVIDAVNRDLPFDQFTIDQMAGDLHEGFTQADVVATGFHRNTQFNREGGSDPEQYRVERVADRLATTGQVFLGLTIGCARCHDHKFDPISQREYYQLFAYLNNSDEPTYPTPSPAQQALLDQHSDRITAAEAMLQQYDADNAVDLAAAEEQLKQTDALPDAIRAILDTAVGERTAEQIKALTAHVRLSDENRQPLVSAVDKPKKLLATLRKQIPTTLIMQERPQRRDTFIHLRGNFLTKGRKVDPGLPRVLPSLENSDGIPARMQLARWLVDERNPLTPRVTINRIWQTFFGLGLVETENDFGSQGVEPTHPQLLDWLSTELVRQQWSLKAMHRLIVTSSVYRQSSRARPDLAQVDPRNQLLARQSPLRLEAEVIRDAALSTGRLLSGKMGGPGVFPPQPPGVMELTRTPGRKWKVSRGEDRYRRGVYTYFWRSTPHPMLKTFDAPDSNTSCTRRDRSNTPLQALMLLNDEAMVEAAQALAARALHMQPADDPQRCRAMFRWCLTRDPTDAELNTLTELLAAERGDDQGTDTLPATPALARMPAGTSPVETAAYTSLARTLLNLDEFITRE